MRYIKLDSIVRFISNNCIRDLRMSVLKEVNVKKNCLKFGEYYIITDNNISTSKNEIDLGKIDRLTLKEEDRIGLAIMIFLNHDEENILDQYKIICTNIFDDRLNSNINISKKFIINIKRQFEDGLKIVENFVEAKDLLIIENHCEFCNNINNCQEDIIRKNKLQILSILTFEDIEYLNKNNIYFLDELTNKIGIIDNAHEFLKDKKADIKKFLQQFDCSEKKVSLLNKYYLNWNESNKAREYIVTFQGHSKTDIVYSFSIKSLFNNESIKCKHIIMKEKPLNKEQIILHYSTIIKEIYECINKNHKEEKDVVFYVLAPYERKNFEKIIETLIQYQSHIKNLNELLFVSEYFGFNYYIQEETKIYINPFIETWIDIKSLIEKYFVINIPFKYTFKETLESFCENEVDIDESIISDTFKMSWALSPKCINEIWYKNFEVGIESIIKSRFDYLECFIINFKNKIKEKEITPSKRSFKDNNSFLGRFIVKEAVTTIKEYKSQFTNIPFERLVEKGVFLECELPHSKTSFIDKFNKNKYFYEFSLKQNEYQPNFINRMVEAFESNSFTEFLEMNSKFQNILKDLTFANEFGKCATEKNIQHKFYISESCYDNNEKANDIKLLSNLNKNIDIKNILNGETFKLEYREIKDLIGKQIEVYRNLCNKKVTLLWGPPGTGKTFCIGQMVNQILKTDPELKILVTGFTHLSIENCLEKIIKYGVNKNKVCKLDKMSSLDGNAVLLSDTSAKYNFKYFDTLEFSVVGSTVYKITQIPEEEEYDLIIVDEASQLKIPEFLMILNRINNKTKFLIVGDNKQLPPIVKNRYLNEKREPILETSSIFDYLFSKKENIVQLEECFRMNKTISYYPSNMIYDGKLTSYVNNEYDILKFNTDLDERNYLSYIAHEDYPVILCLIDNNGERDSKNKIESELTSNLALYFKQNLKYEGSFWKKNLSVVSPHHSQINLIKKDLEISFENENENDKLFFVDTVDKIQGQESDIVIVSYGVTDSLIALKEKEFIYNLNRLNVSITRARKKLVVIMSKGLLDINHKLIDDEKLKEHIEFMTGYVNYVKEKKENRSINDIEIYRMKITD